MVKFLRKPFIYYYIGMAGIIGVSFQNCAQPGNIAFGDATFKAVADVGSDPIVVVADDDNHTTPLPIGEDPIEVPPIKVPPPVDVPPIKVPPVDVPPIKVPPVDVPPIKVPPIKVPPVDVPPIELPPIKVPPVKVPPIDVPPVKVPPLVCPLEIKIREINITGTIDGKRATVTASLIAKNSVSSGKTTLTIRLDRDVKIQDPEYDIPYFDVTGGLKFLGAKGLLNAVSFHANKDYEMSLDITISLNKAGDKCEVQVKGILLRLLEDVIGILKDGKEAVKETVSASKAVVNETTTATKAVVKEAAGATKEKVEQTTGAVKEVVKEVLPTGKLGVKIGVGISVGK